MDDFDFSQFPDFPELFPDLGEDIFDQPVTKDKDGIIECPFLALRDIVLFPQMVMPLFIGRERSLAAINAANTKRENLIVATQRDSNVVDPDESGLFEIGTETTIGRLLRMPDESTSVLAQGRRRVEILEFTQWTPYIRVRARVIEDVEEWKANTEALMRAVLALFEKVVGLNHNLPEEAIPTRSISMNRVGWPTLSLRHCPSPFPFGSRSWKSLSRIPDCKRSACCWPRSLMFWNSKMRSRARFNKRSIAPIGSIFSASRCALSRASWASWTSLGKS